MTDKTIKWMELLLDHVKRIKQMTVDVARADDLVMSEYKEITSGLVEMSSSERSELLDLSTALKHTFEFVERQVMRKIFEEYDTTDKCAECEDKQVCSIINDLGECGNFN